MAKLSYKDTDALINKLRMVVYVLLAIPLLIFVITYLRTNKGTSLKAVLPESFIAIGTTILIVVILAIVLSSFILFGKKMKKARQLFEIEQKLKVYYEAVLFKFGIYEAAMVIALIGLYLTAQPVFTAIFIALIFIFSIENPSIQKLMRQLKLTKEEKRVLLHREEG